MMDAIPAFLDRAARILFFTGTGGVGKTSVACATAVALAARGRRVLLVSTDPASNLDEVLQTALGDTPRPVLGAPGLSALNIDPEAAARAYRERAVGPYRDLLPAAAVRRLFPAASRAALAWGLPTTPGAGPLSFGSALGMAAKVG